MVCSFCRDYSISICIVVMVNQLLLVRRPRMYCLSISDKILAVPMHSKKNRNLGVVASRKHKAISIGIIHLREEKKVDGPMDRGFIIINVREELLDLDPNKGFAEAFSFLDT